MPAPYRVFAVVLGFSWAGAAPAFSQARLPEPLAVSSIVKLTNIETSYPYWSPDGRRIVYQSNHTGNSEIYVMNADGTGARQPARTLTHRHRPLRTLGTYRPRCSM